MAGYDNEMAVLADFKKHLQKKWPDMKTHWIDIDEEKLAKLVKSVKEVKGVKFDDCANYFKERK